MDHPYFPDLPVSDPAVGTCTERFKAVFRNPFFLAFGIIIIILLVSFIAAMIFMYSFMNRSKHTQVSEYLVTATTTPINTEVPTLCFSRQFRRLEANILYSFDCSRATDDISGTFNGVPDALLYPDIDNQTLPAILPTYVTPDYSGQGRALKLNSSIACQYIDLLRSPKLFNRSFTISAWIKPALSAESFTALFAQSYKDNGFHGIFITDLYLRLAICGENVRALTPLKNLQWQYVTFFYAYDALEVGIYIDGIISDSGRLEYPQYSNFVDPKTVIGSSLISHSYNGLIDQLSIVFNVRWKGDVLDEATLVVYYRFEYDDARDDSLFIDHSANAIQATGEHVMRSIGNRIMDQSTLRLYDSSLSWFQSSGFVLLFTHNYTYSYAVWLYVKNVSSFMPLIHLVAKDEISQGKNNDSICLAMLVANATDPNNNTIQLSLYINGPAGYHIIISNKTLSQSTWFHVVVLSRSNGFDLYVDGTLVASSDNFYMSAIQPNNQQRLTLTIGNPRRASIDDNLYGSICRFDGALVESNGSIIEVDNLRFYSRLLKLKEIEAIANDVAQPTDFFFS